MKPRKLNKLEKKVKKIQEKEIDSLTKLHDQVQCSGEQFNFSINMILQGVKDLDSESPNPVSVAAAPNHFEMVVNSRFGIARYMNYGENGEVILMNKPCEVLNVSYGLSDRGRVSKLQWLNEVAPNFLHTNLNPIEFDSSKHNCNDKGFLLASKHYEQLKTKLKNGINVHDTLNYAHEEYNENGILGWELNDTKMTEIDIVNTALFTIYVMNPITTLDISYDNNNCPKELFLQIGESQIDAYDIYHFYRGQKHMEFKALRYMILSINCIILAELIKAKLKKRRLY
jgi:hypothetical protein